MGFKIKLIPDGYHLHHVGILESGSLFWTTGQLDWSTGDTRDFVATYVFDSDGRLIWHLIDDLGFRSDQSAQSPRAVIKQHLEKLGPHKINTIEVSPFSLESHGLTFGLIIRKPNPDDTPEYLEHLRNNGPLIDAMPGNTLMFYPPWEEGLYDS